MNISENLGGGNGRADALWALGVTELASEKGGEFDIRPDEWAANTDRVRGLVLVQQVHVLDESSSEPEVQPGEPLPPLCTLSY